MFEEPTKGDLDRQLSTIMHEAHHRARDQKAKLTSRAVMNGALNGSRFTLTLAGPIDRFHKEAIEQATVVMRTFAEKIKGGPKQVTEWSRPHLENMGNTLLSVIPVASVSDGQRLRTQYLAVFDQRLDGALRDIEIGFVRGAGFTAARAVAAADAPKEILALKPGLWGVSIDLKAAWKRLRG